MVRQSCMTISLRCTVDAGLICGDGVFSIVVSGCRGWPFMNVRQGLSRPLKIKQHVELFAIPICDI